MSQTSRSNVVSARCVAYPQLAEKTVAGCQIYIEWHLAAKKNSAAPARTISARGLAQSKTLRAIREPSARAPAFPGLRWQAQRDNTFARMNRKSPFALRPRRVTFRA